jgi:hypothetical protein
MVQSTQDRAADDIQCHFAKVSGKTSGGLECRSIEPGGQKSRHKLDRGP